MMQILKTSMIKNLHLHQVKDSIRQVYTKIKVRNTYAFHLYFVVRGLLAKMKDEFQFIIVTLLNGNCEMWIGELHNQFQTIF